MNITVGALLEKHRACTATLDPKKTCHTCLHKDRQIGAMPCSGRYDELLGLPVNPTNWKAKE